MTNIFGWYDRFNCGDEAFKISFEKLFGKDLKFTNEKIESSCSRIVLGGGDVIKDYYLRKIPTETKFSVIGCGLGYEDEIHLLKSRNVEKVFLRNYKDVDLASAAGVSASYCPDLAFLIDVPPIMETLKRSAPEKKKLAVILTDAINVSASAMKPEMFYAEFFKSEMARSLDYLAEWYEIYFIPMSHELYSFDTKMHLDVACRMKAARRDNIFMDCPSPVEMIKLIQQMDLVVTAKFHGLIFSVLTGTPFVNVGVTRKTELFCQEHSLNKMSVPPYSFLKDRFLENVKAAEAEGVREQLAAITQEKKALWSQIQREHF